jgi:hypothetical protein
MLLAKLSSARSHAPGETQPSVAPCSWRATGPETTFARYSYLAFKVLGVIILLTGFVALVGLAAGIK